VRVLMLGWEFPPQISGGLGTACYGLSRGLAEEGVEVIFVVPRVLGGEHAAPVELIGADRLALPPELASPPSEAAEPGAEERVPVRLRHAFGGQRSTTRPPAASTRHPGLERTFELLEVDSPLRPYLDEASYAERLEGIHGDGGAEQGVPVPAPTAAALGLPGGDLGLHLRGAYGESLRDEVRRYAHVVGELAREREFDVVHAHDWMTYPAGIVAARLRDKPLVVHVHACEYDRHGDRPDARIRELEQHGMDEADRVVCVSAYTANVLRKHYRVSEDKLRIVHNAVTQREQRDTLHWEKRLEDPVVLFLGRITYQKGPDYFLEAAARVLAVRPSAQFVLSGSGDMLPKMVERAAQLGIARNTHFTGFLEGEDVERMFAMADVYVMPSVSEPFGISPLEAMALDIPVIVSRQSGVSEVLANALKVDFWDVEDLANKILALLAYPALREELSEEGKEEVRTMRWEERGRSLKAVYEELAP